VSLWRLLVAGCAFFGFFSAVSRMYDPMVALSQQASLLAGVVYLGLLLYPLVTRRLEPRSPWWPGAMTILLMLVCVTYLTVLNGSLSGVWSLFEHLVTPLVVLVDFLLIGRNQGATKWWYPITWLGFPLAYLVYYLAADLRLYGSFLNPNRGTFPSVIAGFILALLAFGYLLHGYGRLRRITTRTGDPAQWRV
jgi:hypothetical protein